MGKLRTLIKMFGLATLIGFALHSILIFFTAYLSGIYVHTIYINSISEAIFEFWFVIIAVMCAILGVIFYLVDLRSEWQKVKNDNIPTFIWKKYKTQ